MLKTIIQKIKQDNAEFDNHYREIKSQKSKSRQRFNDEYIETESRIDEIRNRINSIHNK